VARAVDREIREDVADLLARYASGIDRRDWIVLAPDNVRGAQSAGFYDDVVVRAAGGWKIARRTFTMVRLQMLGSP
jgi:hypothetical protein